MMSESSQEAVSEIEAALNEVKFELPTFTCNAVPDVCSYLWMDINVKTGKGTFSCNCEEATCAGCIPNGECPIRPKIKKYFDDLSNTMKQEG